MRLTPEQRLRNEQRIRAAMDRLLADSNDSARQCDVRTLAREAVVARSALYSTYRHLREEFEARRQLKAGTLPQNDNSTSQIDALRSTIADLQGRVSRRNQEIADLQEFKKTALSRLLAQHEEITALRTAIHLSSKNISILKT